MSAADVWMPLYVADYLKDTGHLGHAEHGCYLLLLAQSWTMGPLPADEVSLSRLARCPLREWRKIAPVVLAFFEMRDGKLVSPRLERERADAQSNAERRTDKAAQAARARWDKHAASNAPGMLQALHVECPSPSPSPEEERTPPPPSVVGSPRGCRLPPDWTPSQPEREFAESLGLNPDAVAAQFADYWHAKAGKDAAKRDWPATWRGWCRREAANSSRPLQKKPGKLDWLYDQMRREREERQASEPEPREARLIL